MKFTRADIRRMRTPGKYNDGQGVILHVITKDRRNWFLRYMRSASRCAGLARGTWFMADLRKRDGVGAATLAFAILTAARSGEAWGAMERVSALSPGNAHILVYQMSGHMTDTRYHHWHAVPQVKSAEGVLPGDWPECPGTSSESGSY
jgi:hypothetical protein